MSDADALTGRVEALVEETLLIEVPSADTDLVKAGLIDSLALLTLITEIETTFGIQLPMEDFDIESFRSVDGMTAYVSDSGLRPAGH